MIRREPPVQARTYDLDSGVSQHNDLCLFSVSGEQSAGSNSRNQPRCTGRAGGRQLERVLGNCVALEARTTSSIFRDAQKAREIWVSARAADARTTGKYPAAARAAALPSGMPSIPRISVLRPALSSECLPRSTPRYYGAKGCNPSHSAAQRWRLQRGHRSDRC
jgi:hypothetical protein